MKIQCTLHREGGTVVEMPGQTYHFTPQGDGRHVAEVTIEAHIERFLSIPEAYKIARSAAGEAAAATFEPRKDGDAPAATLPDGEALSGSSSNPATFDIAGKTHALAEVVKRAFTDSCLAVENWNELPEETRALKIDLVLDGIVDGEIEIPSWPAPLEDKPDERTLLVQQYQEKFGKSPGNMRTETIRAKLAE